MADTYDVFRQKVDVVELPQTNFLVSQKLQDASLAAINFLHLFFFLQDKGGVACWVLTPLENWARSFWAFSEEPPPPAFLEEPQKVSWWRTPLFKSWKSFTFPLGCAMAIPSSAQLNLLIQASLPQTLPIPKPSAGYIAVLSSSHIPIPWPFYCGSHLHPMHPPPQFTGTIVLLNYNLPPLSCKFWVYPSSLSALK